jgi:hypothetical protein
MPTAVTKSPSDMHSNSPAERFGFLRLPHDLRTGRSGEAELIVRDLTRAIGTGVIQNIDITKDGDVLTVELKLNEPLRNGQITGLNRSFVIKQLAGNDLTLTLEYNSWRLREMEFIRSKLSKALPAVPAENIMTASISRHVGGKIRVWLSTGNPVGRTQIKRLKKGFDVLWTSYDRTALFLENRSVQLREGDFPIA